uniref:Uncharacterized protein n=1 Tax=Magallana gigas TaxID=29159 RepID=A0A8W8J2T4_MAGGI
MTSEAISAVQNHLVQVPDTAPYDCASIFNFTPSPPPKRRATSASEKRKICLDVPLTVYKMKNQLQVLRERRHRLALKCQKRADLGVRGEE